MVLDWEPFKIGRPNTETRLVRAEAMFGKEQIDRLREKMAKKSLVKNSMHENIATDGNSDASVRRGSES